MKYALNMGERFGIVALLPAEGELLTMRDVKDMKRSLLPSGKERDEYKFQQDSQGIKWDPEMAEAEVEIDFTTPQVALVVTKLQELKEQKKIKEEHVSLWDKFISEE